MAESNAFIPLNFSVQEQQDMQVAAEAFYKQMATRRSVRDFSDQAIPDSVLENAILAAGTAPSGANMQPWHFVVVQNPEIKAQIRQAAEKEERELYEPIWTSGFLNLKNPFELSPLPLKTLAVNRITQETPKGERKSNREKIIKSITEQ